jgi:hypothetical protein
MYLFTCYFPLLSLENECNTVQLIAIQECLIITWFHDYVECFFLSPPVKFTCFRIKLIKKTFVGIIFINILKISLQYPILESFSYPVTR